LPPLLHEVPSLPQMTMLLYNIQSMQRRNKPKIKELNIRKDTGGATRIEYYCGNGCLETLSKREEEEPTNIEQVADYYGCIKAEVKG
jgi:hypothetical protein